MPELPEVETTRRGIAPHVEGRRLLGAVVREARLRRPVPPDLHRRIAGARVRAVARRAKYLILELIREDSPAGALLIHLGMSGSLRVLDANAPPGPHDHVDLRLEGGRALRLRDPRRFGLVLFCPGDPPAHPLLAGLGPEPLDPGFDGAALAAALHGRRSAVKAALLDQKVVAGVGNIYACEALFEAGIHPARPAGRIAPVRLARLAGALRAVMAEAVAAGGSTLRDFVGGDGRPGYFQHRFRVYGRAGAPCPRCGGAIRRRLLAQRVTYYCPRCQR
ncbi:bifunctional DNA-formamidopyrimidine glycosylase/DNA-(apurinic or apyrimidinic site) lyase [Inmirania thermothiophila]|uniref:Formamidopyrimidine-DNA glycosylase n=1 Tax=Inmirania thermothiophila TaxID=1750597 RepID=A0A3N1YA50_9GAMM|nr:bifunctional DNA-formamidopyrimidine glycosylase/DNA-(apurinic or apyrimidinic site) lyase [Inmirania thermothiophila]ROR34277.1 DNA-(apurinic or apyrimidinic site) lyase [Inmirania thermothiophila]